MLFLLLLHFLTVSCSNSEYWIQDFTGMTVMGSCYQSKMMPTPRMGAPTYVPPTTSDTSVVMYGGYGFGFDSTSQCKKGLLNDIWIYSRVSESTASWTAKVPPALQSEFSMGQFVFPKLYGEPDSQMSYRRLFHTLWSDNFSGLLTFGGYASSPGSILGYSNDVQRVALPSYGWHGIEPGGLQSYTYPHSRPPPVVGHTTVVSKSNPLFSYTFGGRVMCSSHANRQPIYKSEIWELNSSATFWGHDAFIWKNLFVPNGGQCRTGDMTQISDTETRCDDAADPFAYAHYCDEASPGGRYGHVSWVFEDWNGDRLYIFGGEGAVGGEQNRVMYSDVWVYSVPDEQWAILAGGKTITQNWNRIEFVSHEMVYDKSFTPGSRSFSLLVDPYEHTNIAIFGGIGFESNRSEVKSLNDIWLWSHENHVWQRRLHNGSHSGETYPIPIFASIGFRQSAHRWGLWTALGNDGNSTDPATEFPRDGHLFVGEFCSGGKGIMMPSSGGRYTCWGCDYEGAYSGEDCEKYYCNGYEAGYSYTCNSVGVCYEPEKCDCLEGYNGSNCYTYYCHGVSNFDDSVCNGYMAGQCLKPNQCNCSVDLPYYGLTCDEYISGAELYDRQLIVNYRMPVSKLSSLVLPCSEVFGNSTGLQLDPSPVCGFVVDDAEPDYTSMLLANFTQALELSAASIEVLVQTKAEIAWISFMNLRSEVWCYNVSSFSSAVCSGHGGCAKTDECSCYFDYENDGNRFKGHDCSNWTCYGVTQSDDNVCNGHGSCEWEGTVTDLPHCICHPGYSHDGNENVKVEDICNFWECGGLPASDGAVCTASGNCTAPGHCECESYASGDLCDVHSYLCNGHPADSDESCGAYGDCLGMNECLCHTNYLKIDGKCVDWKCYGTAKDANDVCSGYPEACVKPDSCSCPKNRETRNGVISNFGTQCQEEIGGSHWEDPRRVMISHSTEGMEVLAVEDPAFLLADENQYYWDCAELLYEDPFVLGIESCYFLTEESVDSQGGATVTSRWLVFELTENNQRIVDGVSLRFRVLRQRSYFVNKELLETAEITLVQLWSDTFLEPIIGGIAGGLGFLLLVLGLVLCCVILRIRRNKSLVKEDRSLSLNSADIDLYLIQQEEEDGSLAKLNINQSLFTIDVDDLKILSKIGESNAKVYLCNWVGREAVFKSFRAHDVFSKESYAQDFEREVELLSSMNHPSLVNFYGVVLKPPRVGLVIEYLPNGTLKKLIKDSPEERQIDLTFERKIDILQEVASAVAFLHAKSVVHRDLKPDNIMLDQNWRPKLIDFGTGKVLDNIATSQGMTRRIGTSYYMSPEVSLSDSYDGRCDVFSLAIVMYELLLEQVPAFKTIVPAIELRIANDDFFRPEVNEEEWQEHIWVIQLMMKCWQGNPDDRPTMSEVVDALEKKEFTFLAPKSVVEDDSSSDEFLDELGGASSSEDDDEVSSASDDD